MVVAKLQGIVTKDYRLELKVPRSVPPGKVEVIVLRPAVPVAEGEVPARSGRVNVHPAAGMWADRKDILDPIVFAAKLRRRLETRRDARA